MIHNLGTDCLSPRSSLSGAIHPRTFDDTRFFLNRHIQFLLVSFSSPSDLIAFLTTQKGKKSQSVNVSQVNNLAAQSTLLNFCARPSKSGGTITLCVFFFMNRAARKSQRAVLPISGFPVKKIKQKKFQTTDTSSP